MNTCPSLHSINWLWYIVSVVVVFITGGIWFSRKVFGTKWMEVFNIQRPAEENVKAEMFLPLIIQIITSAFLGFVMFLLTAATSGWFAFLVLIAFCAWQKMNLKFKIQNFKQYAWAASIEVGYMFVAGVIFILFALI